MGREEVGGMGGYMGRGSWGGGEMGGVEDGVVEVEEVVGVEGRGKGVGVGNDGGGVWGGYGKVVGVREVEVVEEVGEEEGDGVWE